MKDPRKDTPKTCHDKAVRKYDVNQGKKVKAVAKTKEIKADKKEKRSDVKDLKEECQTSGCGLTASFFIYTN